MQNYSPPSDMDEDEAPVKAKKGKAKKAKDPKAPKRTQTAYILFGKVARAKIKEENSGISQSDIMKMIGAKWNAMSDEEKKPYHDQASQDKARFESEKASYEQNKEEEQAEEEPMDEDDGSDGGDQPADDEDLDDDDEPTDD